MVSCLCCNGMTTLAFMLCVKKFDDPNDCQVLDCERINLDYYMRLSSCWLSHDTSFVAPDAIQLTPFSVPVMLHVSSSTPSAPFHSVSGSFA
jgi:hypothetical protein